MTAAHVVQDAAEKAQEDVLVQETRTVYDAAYSQFARSPWHRPGREALREATARLSDALASYEALIPKKALFQFRAYFFS